MKTWIRQQDEADREHERAKSLNPQQQATSVDVSAKNDLPRQADVGEKLVLKAKKKAARKANKKRKKTAVAQRIEKRRMSENNLDDKWHRSGSKVHMKYASAKPDD